MNSESELKAVFLQKFNEKKECINIFLKDISEIAENEPDETGTFGPFDDLDETLEIDPQTMLLDKQDWNTKVLLSTLYYVGAKIAHDRLDIHTSKQDAFAIVVKECVYIMDELYVEFDKPWNIQFEIYGISPSVICKYVATTCDIITDGIN